MIDFNNYEQLNKTIDRLDEVYYLVVLRLAITTRSRLDEKDILKLKQKISNKINAI